MLDQTDEELTRLLEIDARQSSRVLAEQLGIKPSTVRLRMQHLIQKKVLNIVAILDHTKVGFPITAVISFDVVQEKIESMLEKLAACPEVTWLSSTTGRFDILAHARFRSTDELADFLQCRFSTADGVRNTETSVCLQLKKWRSMRK